MCSATNDYKNNFNTKKETIDSDKLAILNVHLREALTFTDQGKVKRLMQAKFTISKTLTWESLLAVIILIEPLQTSLHTMIY